MRATTWPRTRAHAGSMRLLSVTALLAAAMASPPALLAAGRQAAPAPRAVLSCTDLAPLSAGAARTGDRVIEAEGRVSASGAEAVPPYLVVCDGKPRIACIMETPLAGADVGRGVHVMGRLSGGDNRMLVIDPCGATLSP